MGKKGNDLPKILRQELILEIIDVFSGDTGLSTAEIHHLLSQKCPDVNKRTLYRDLDELSCYFPLYEDQVGGTKKWFLNTDVKILRNPSLLRAMIKKQLLEFLSSEDEEPQQNECLQMAS